jgi:hypothetical protein
MKKLLLMAVFTLAGCGSQSPPPAPAHVQTTQESIDEGKKYLQEAKAERRRLHPAEAAAAEAADAAVVAGILAPRTQRTQTTQTVNNEFGYPAECDTMHFSLMNLYSAPNEHSMVWDVFSTGAQGKAWLGVLANGNYSIITAKLLIDSSNGSHYCMAQVHLSGMYAGNSYDGTYWAMAIPAS